MINNEEKHSNCAVYTNLLKGTVSVISSEPPCKDENARYTMVPLKP